MARREAWSAAALQDAAKIGILGTSTLAAVLGTLVLLRAGRRTEA